MAVTNIFTPGQEIKSAELNTDFTDCYLRDGSQTLSNDVKLATNGGASLGESTKAFQYVYLKDTMNSNVYRIEIVSGVLQATLIP